MHAVLVGNYGVENFGDEALKDYFLRAFPDIRWTVLSARPSGSELPRLPLGIRSFFGTPWWKTVRAIRTADTLVFGGGTLFTDIESVRACWLWGLHASVARLFRVPIVLAFQGVGPFRTRRGEEIARWVFRRSSYVSVRDEASIERMRSWHMNTEVIQTFDPVFLSFISRKIEIRSQNVYILIPRHNSGPAFDNVVEMAAIPANAPIEILTFQPDDAGERRVVERLRARYPRATVRAVRTADELMEALAASALCVCERFHGALAAVAAGVPLRIVSQAAGDKLDEVRALSERHGFERAVVAAEEGERTLRTAIGTP